MAFAGGCKRLTPILSSLSPSANVFRISSRRSLASVTEEAPYGYAWSLWKKGAFLLSLPIIWMSGSKFLRGCEDEANEKNVLVKLRRKVYNKTFEWEDQKVHPLTWFMAKYMIMDPREREKFWEDHLLDVKKRREIALAQMRQPENPPIRLMQYPVASYGVEPKGKPIGPDGY